MNRYVSLINRKYLTKNTYLMPLGTCHKIVPVLPDLVILAGTFSKRLQCIEEYTDPNQRYARLHGKI